MMQLHETDLLTEGNRRRSEMRNQRDSAAAVFPYAIRSPEFPLTTVIAVTEVGFEMLGQNPSV